ncbi:MAG: ribosome biogenesis GTPase YlqF [Bacillota bacterium]|nr:ribosome biogenesis GTPase YlqF [Bacillota bacterium]
MLPEFSIQWFPGHMQKAKRNIKENVGLVDLIIEVRDARAPLTSANPVLETLGQNKSKITLLNKADLADQEINRKWQDSSAEMLLFSGKNQRQIKMLQRELNKRGQFLKEDWLKRNKGLRPYRAMVVGMPNVGKSTIINALSKSSKAKTGERPGVTRGKQWITLSNNWQLLDTPGVMIPEALKGDQALFLALINAVDERLYDIELAASHFAKWLKENAPLVIEAKYKIQIEDIDDPFAILEEIGRKRGCLLSGGVIDREKAAFLLLKDFREGGLGRFSLETPKADEAKDDA